MHTKRYPIYNYKGLRVSSKPFSLLNGLILVEQPNIYQNITPYHIKVSIISNETFGTKLNFNKLDGLSLTKGGF